MTSQKAIREKRIKEYAKNYPNPISDIKGFNKVLMENMGLKTTKKTILRLLNY